MKNPITVETATQALPQRLFQGAAERRRAKKLEAQLAEVEAELLEQLKFASPVANAPARYLAEAGGKRVRPLLTILVSELGNGPTEKVKQVAQAIELTHLASLYHDDVMDEASLRRGVDAAHVVWGNSVAILAGDLLFSRASTLVSGIGEEAILLQARTFERLCLGQLHETVGVPDGEDPIEHYLRVLADKTGALIACAARMGILVSDAPREYLEPVTQYGEEIGLAFQLIDDVIDLSPSKKVTGKRAGTDLRAGVDTLPLLLLKRRAETNTDDAALLARIQDGVAQVADGADPSIMDAEVESLRNHEVTAEAEAEAQQAAQRAINWLDDLPAGPVRKALEELALTIVEREG
ncbi:MAG: polyprenyl synthetase family protein [Canibacter sp.]